MFTKFSKPTTYGRTLTLNLPAGVTCPAAGACKKFCYAKKGRFVFTNVGEAHKRNLKDTHDPLWTHNAIEWLRSRRIKPDAVRLHSSGDVYSQEYLNKLTTLAANLPNITFYLYTKSLHLDWTMFDKLQNTSRIQSYGGIHNNLIDWTKPVAIVAQTKEEELMLEALGFVDGTKDDGLAARGTPKIYLRIH